MVIKIFDKTNYLNSITSEVSKSLTSAIGTKINLTGAKITISRNALTINTIASSSDYYILLIFPRSSGLRFSSERYADVKKKMYRVDIFVIAQSEAYCLNLISKLQYYFDRNEFDFTSFGLKKPQLQNEFLKVADSKIFSSQGLTGNFAAFANTISGEIWV